MATTARIRSGVGGHRRQVETLVAPAGDEHDVPESTDRRGRRMWGRRLRVVEPGDATRFGDQLDAVRRADERGQRRGHRGNVAKSGLEHQGGGRQAVGDVVGQAAAHRGHRSDLAAGRDQDSVLDAIVGAGRPNVT